MKRILSAWLMVLGIACCAAPHAQAAMNPTIEVISVTWQDDSSHVAAFSRSVQSEYAGADVACEQLRSYMVDRTENFEIQVQKRHGNDLSQDAILDFTDDMLSEAMSHTKDPKEGDYIRFNLDYCEYSIRYFYDENWMYLTISYNMDYFTTAAQEDAVDAAVGQVVQELCLNTLNDAEKICRIYEYITENVSYDYAGLNDETDLLKYSTYGALIEGSAVCQGYASLLYRLALECGVDTRVISGIGDNGTAQERHAWNIVELNDQYYNLDATWDAGRVIYDMDYAYFLKSGSGFSDHIRDPIYDDNTFHIQYPMAEEDYDWKTISDTVVQGEFIFYIDSTGAVLYCYTGNDATVEIPSQVNGKPVYAIGGSAFCENNNLIEIVIPASVEIILDGNYVDGQITGAFSRCEKLETVTISGDSKLSVIGEWAFYECKKLSSVILPASIRTLGLSCFELCTSLTELTLPEGLTTVSQNALGSTGLTEICIPASCTEFHRWQIFLNLTQFVVEEGNPVFRTHEGVLYTRDGGTWILTAYPMMKPETTYRVPDFCGYVSGEQLGVDHTPKYLKTLYIGETQGLPGWTGGDSLTRIECRVIPDSTNPYYQSVDGFLLSKDGKTVIQAPSGEKRTFVIPDGVEIVPSYTFWLKEDLNIVFPSSVTFVDNAAIGDCTAPFVLFRGSAPVFDQSAFSSSNCKIYYPEGDSSWSACVEQSYRGSTVDWVVYQPVPTLTATTNAQGNPVLKWNAVVGASRYQLFRYDSDTMVWSEVNDLSATEHTDTSVVMGKTYQYRVRSYMGGIWHDFSSPVSVTCTAAGEICVPVITVSTRASDGKPTISWEAVSDATGYEVYYCGTSKGAYKLLYTAKADKLNVTNTGAVVGNDYFYKVRAIRGDEKGEFSEAKGVWCDLARPTVTVKNRASDGKPTISWTAVEGAAGYEVYRCGTSTGDYTKLITTAANKLSVTHTGAAVGNDYFYKVKAIYGSNASCDSALTAAKGVWVDLKQPTVKVLNSVSTGKPVIQWEKVDYAVGYKVYVSETSGGSYKLLYSTTNPDKLSVTHTGAKAENDYFYKVVAVHKNSKCDSAMSAAKGVWCDLARPTLTVSLNSKGKPYLNWTESVGADAYKVYRSTDGNTWTLMYTAEGNDLDVAHTGAKSGVNYSYKVLAISNINSKANSSHSVVKSIVSK